MKSIRHKSLTWIRWLLAFFMTGLILSGASAIPLVREVDSLVAVVSANGSTPIASWLARVQDALHDSATHHPFLFYGTDWLAFGHIVIAISFVGAWRDPVRNAWLFDFGLIACGLVIPWALVFGSMRGIPGWWQMIDCSFGLFGALPLFICKKLLNDIERTSIDSTGDHEAARIA